MAYNPINPNGAATSANSEPVVIASDQAAIPVNLNDGTGLAINSLSAGTGANGLMTANAGTNFIFSTVNSSVAQLAASATFTGVLESTINQVDLSLLFVCDQPCTITVNQYITTNINSLVSSWIYNVSANASLSRSFSINGNFVNVVVKNTGLSTTTTLNLNTAYGQIEATSQLGNGPVSVNEVGGYPIYNGLIPMTLPENQDEFGQLAVAQRVNDLQCIFIGSGTLSTITSPVYTGSGAGTWANGQAIFTTGTTNPSTVYVPSQGIVTYVPGAEVYAYFTAYFSAGAAGSFQRIGITDKINGFFVGQEATVFSVSIVTGSTITSISQSNFSLDTLTGLPNSRFTRNNVPEAYNPLMQNVFRIRFGWVGSAPTIFEILSPDGLWVAFHSIKTPNSQNTPSIQNNALPVSVWMSSIGTSLTVGTSCWAAGTSSPFTLKNAQPGGYMPTQDAKDSGRTYMTFYIDAIAGVTTEALVTMNINTAGTVTTATSYTVPAGKTLRLAAISSTVKSTNTTAQSGRLRVRSAVSVAASSGIVMNIDVPSINGTIASGVGSAQNYSVPDGIEIAAGQQIGISQIMSAINTTVSCFVTGFLY